jgi:two-component system, NarL family, sensor histidine kinase DegS
VRRPNLNSAYQAAPANRLPNKERRLHRTLELYKQERRLIVYDLHDGLAQYLAGALIHFQAFKTCPKADSQTSSTSWDNGLNFLKRSITELRCLMRGLQPGVVEEFGIMAAMSDLVDMHRDDYGIDIQFRHAVQFDRLAAPLENALFRILQETIGNACRHSGSKRILVKIVQRDRRIRIETRDWGIGFVLENVDKNRLGLMGIRERAKLFGGRAVIMSAPSAGTRIIVELPIVKANPA